MNEYVGALHMHSNFSDGSGDAGEIAEIANEVGLDFIVLTDHNTLRALHEGFEGFYGKTFMLVGCEINDKENKNHYIALGISETFSTRLPAKDYVRKVKKAGGIGFLAHPHEKRNSMKEHPPYPWTEWETDDFTGIEIWNHMSEWMESLTEQNKYQSFLHPLKTIVSPPKETLELWDKLSLERKVIGIGGIDAHAHKVNVLGFVEVEVFPYKVLFKSIRTHILTDRKFVNNKNPEGVAATKEIILSSLKEGNCFVSNYYHGDATGFRFIASKGKHNYQMGETAPLDKGLKLRVFLPGNKGTIKIIRNGICVTVMENQQSIFEVDEPGVYRVEVYIGEKAWIFSNHIRIESKKK
jgi:hypothetical protein